MKRITVDITSEMQEFLEAEKTRNGSSINFEANKLMEMAKKERERKKKQDTAKAKHSYPA